MKKGFDSNIIEEQELLKKFKDEVRKFTKEYVNKLFRDINTNLKRRFKNEFETDQNGKMRNWVSIEES